LPQISHLLAIQISFSQKPSDKIFFFGFETPNYTKYLPKKQDIFPLKVSSDTLSCDIQSSVERG